MADDGFEEGFDEGFEYDAMVGDDGYPAPPADGDAGAAGGGAGGYGASVTDYGGVHYNPEMVEHKGVEADYTSAGLMWSRPVMTGVPPKARGGHAAGLVGNLLIVVGGHYYGGGGQFVYLDDVWAIDVDTMTWHNPTCAGGGPSPRYGHTATVIEYKLYVFGGRGPKGVLHNDLWRLDVERWTWERMSSTTAAPSPRFGHSQALVGHKIVYFGGWDGKTAFNDLWVYDTLSYSWLRPRLAGLAPSPRFNHVSGVSTDGRIVIFGGATLNEKGHPKYVGDVYQLDTETMVWGRGRVFGEHPPGRASHQCCVVNNVMVCFGGWQGEFQRVPANESADKKKPAADDPGSTHPHTFVLNFDTMEWTQPIIKGTQPAQRYNHSLTAVDSRLLVFGGWDGNRALNDVIQLEVGHA